MSTFSLPVFVSPPPPRLPPPPSPSLSPLAGPPAPPCLPPPVSSQPGTYGAKRLRPVLVRSSICVFSFPASCVFVIFALAGAANSFPLTPSLFFFFVFFRVNTQRIQEIPNIYRGNGRAPWALQEHSGFRFPAEIYRPLTPLDDDETIALRIEQRGGNTSWPCHDLDTILIFSTGYYKKNIVVK